MRHSTTLVGLLAVRPALLLALGAVEGANPPAPAPAQNASPAKPASPNPRSQAIPLLDVVSQGPPRP